MKRLLGTWLTVLVVVLPLASSSHADPVTTTAPVRVLPAGSATFAPDHLVWAKGSTIHDGRRRIDIGEHKISRLLRTPYGFFVQFGKRYYTRTRIGFHNGRRLTWLPRTTEFPRISPDGRLAGWVDRLGPPIRHGRSARIQVVDLSTGLRVFASSQGMGTDTDLYGEVEPQFLGFDEQFVYWRRVEGKIQRVRTDLTTWQTTEAATIDEDFIEHPIGEPWDSVSGKPVLLARGRIADHGTHAALHIGFLSPDGRFAFNTSTTARLKVTDPTSGRRIDPDWGRWRGFVGWRDPDTFYAALPRRFSYISHPAHGDGIRGWFAACDLPSGRCTRLRRFRDADRIVFGWGGGFEGPG